ncbi:hypothetical protein PoB_003209600 [Plakobranchus ocellatus]|uniref:Secreted protein n=1 Tax=Plakobranchus ocellatus TaxID=259542 RepID=A0AAV4A2W2_9GAST|nr:hypothetical protein PoB_003209600 [Plakobranchus ocellatus]
MRFSTGQDLRLFLIRFFLQAARGQAEHLQQIVLSVSFTSALHHSLVHGLPMFVAPLKKSTASVYMRSDSCWHTVRSGCKSLPGRHNGAAAILDNS